MTFPAAPAFDRTTALDFVGRVPLTGKIVELRAPSGADGKPGAKLGGADLDTLIAKAVARERVECEVDFLAYEQGSLDGKGRRIPNRKGVRIRDGALAAAARSAIGAPFLRDHDAGSVLAKGGEIIASRLERGDNGYARIVQTVRLMDPDAVQRAARGLMSAVSVRIQPQAGSTITCTAHKSEIGTKCMCLPLDTLELDGAEHTVEWEYSNPHLPELSEVTIGAVENAGPISPVRAALALLQASATTVNVNSDHIPKDPPMKRTITLLGLAETAGDDAAAVAVEKLQADLKTAKAEIAVVETREAAQATELAAFREAKKTTERAAFLDGLVGAGKVADRDRGVWGDLYDADPAKAQKRAEGLAVNSATPVGAAPQSIVTAANEPAALAAPKAEYTKDGATLLAIPGETREQYQARKAAATAAKKAV